MPTKAPQFRPAHSVFKGEWQRDAQRKKFDEDRGNSTKRGYDSRWQVERRAWLMEHPLCVSCENKGRTAAASVVDHIVPHKGDREKFWDKKNWQGLCRTCHNSKTAREDSNFARRKK